MRKELERQVEEQHWLLRIARVSAVSDVARRVAWGVFAVAVVVAVVRQLAPD